MDPISLAEEERLRAMMRASRLGAAAPREADLPSVAEAQKKVDALQAQRTPHALDGSDRAAFQRGGNRVLPRGLVMKAPTATEWAVTPAGAMRAADLANQMGVRAYRV